jgi:hypothetical protein
MAFASRRRRRRHSRKLLLATRSRLFSRLRSKILSRFFLSSQKQQRSCGRHRRSPRTRQLGRQMNYKSGAAGKILCMQSCSEAAEQSKPFSALCFFYVTVCCCNPAAASLCRNEELRWGRKLVPVTTLTEHARSRKTSMHILLTFHFMTSAAGK